MAGLRGTHSVGNRTSGCLCEASPLLAVLSPQPLEIIFGLFFGPHPALLLGSSRLPPCWVHWGHSRQGVGHPMLFRDLSHSRLSAKQAPYPLFSLADPLMLFLLMFWGHTQAFCFPKPSVPSPGSQFSSVLPVRAAAVTSPRCMYTQQWSGPWCSPGVACHVPTMVTLPGHAAFLDLVPALSGG